MQALHRKLDIVLVQFLRYNCSETDYSFCEDSPLLSRTPPSTRMWVSPSDPFSPPPFFSLRHPWVRCCFHFSSLRPATCVTFAWPITGKRDVISADPHNRNYTTYCNVAYEGPSQRQRQRAKKYKVFVESRLRPRCRILTNSTKH